MKAVLNGFPGKAFLVGGILLAGIFSLTSCREQARGFVLPEGNVEAGRQLFATMRCVECHSIGTTAWVGTGRADDPHVRLGGDVTKLKSYGELVTSVINPSHKISQKAVADSTWMMGEHSKMEAYDYNKVLTVQQLIDLVAFLQSEYNLVVPTNPYPYH